MDIRKAIRNALGGGNDINAGNPLPVTSVLSAASLHVDPFTSNGDIAPAAVKSSAIGVFKACRVSIHFSVATSNPITIALDAFRGPEYDVPLIIEPMGAETDFIYYFPEGAKFEAGDVVTVDWTDDTVGAATWGVEIVWEGS